MISPDMELLGPGAHGFAQSPSRFADDGMFLQDRALRQLGEKSDFIHAGRESLDRLDGIEHVGQIGPITPHG